MKDKNTDIYELPEAGQLRAAEDDGLYLVFGLIEKHTIKNSLNRWRCLILEKDSDYPDDPAGMAEDIPQGWIMTYTRVIAR